MLNAYIPLSHGYIKQKMEGEHFTVLSSVVSSGVSVHCVYHIHISPPMVVVGCMWLASH